MNSAIHLHMKQMYVNPCNTGKGHHCHTRASFLQAVLLSLLWPLRVTPLAPAAVRLLPALASSKPSSTQSRSHIKQGNTSFGMHKQCLFMLVTLLQGLPSG